MRRKNDIPLNYTATNNTILNACIIYDSEIVILVPNAGYMNMVKYYRPS